ncbi:MAG: GCN5-related N-acetyltransferase [Proteobacteria bacterium SG_bin6]|nr:MAG: GCN5-related N-acetyltransferase [Proteobacteria bacterium SG_bin6]
MSRAALEARCLDLTRLALPAVAAARGWPIRADHCFQRVLLDAACCGVWYDRIAGRPAYAHAPAPLLAEAVRLGEAVLAGAVALAPLNRQSLAWRRVGRASLSQQSASSEALHRLL